MIPGYENDKTRDMLYVLGVIVWKYGDVFIGEDGTETHIVKVSPSDVYELGRVSLEVYHDDEDKEGATYYRIIKNEAARQN